MKRPPMTPMPLIVSLLALLVLGSAAQAQALAQEPSRHGRALLKEYCAGCHAIGKTGNSPHRGALPFRTLGRSFDLDQFPRALERGISASHPAMPEFKFSTDDARAVSAYLRMIQE